MKILIGYDGSECANAAIEDLKFAGLPADTEVLILTITETWLPSNEPDEDCFAELLDDEIKWYWRNKALEKVAECEKFALEAWERLRAIFPEWQIRHETKSGYPEWAVVAKAKKLQSDLIVVGSQGHSKIGRFVLGSVSLKVLSEAPCSVRVARQSLRQIQNDESPFRLIVGIDGSPDSHLAVESLIQRQWLPDTKVRLVTANELVNHPGDEDQTKKAEELRHFATETLEKMQLSVSSVVKPGKAKDLLLEEAEKWNADTIFLGAKGHRFMERIFLGSVSYAVTARANCSVEVVRGV